MTFWLTVLAVAELQRQIDSAVLSALEAMRTTLALRLNRSLNHSHLIAVDRETELLRNLIVKGAS